MTTRVRIQNCEQGGDVVRVEVVQAGMVMSQTPLPPGRAEDFFVHGGCHLRVTELRPGEPQSAETD